MESLFPPLPEENGVVRCQLYAKWYRMLFNVLRGHGRRRVTVLIL